MKPKFRELLRAAEELKHTAAEIAKRPGPFAMRVLKGFKANQGLLLAGAVAYYTLLSLVPLLILIVIGPVVTVTMIFSSALAFAVLENSMSVIFYHRVRAQRRRFVVSAVLPYTFILCLGAGLLAMTIVSGRLAVLASHNQLLSNYLLYFMGVGGEILVLTAIYQVMPIGRLSWSHALIGGVTATVLWELSRHVLLWYYASISHMKVVYGSLTTAIVVLISVEVAAIVMLLGAQVIAEYERVLLEPDAEPTPVVF